MMPTNHMSTAELLERARRRQRERGAAVFVVVLVITLVTGLGVFAVRSAGIANAASGYNRQLTQVHYITDYAIHATVAVTAGNPESVKVQMMRGPQSGHAECVGYTAQKTALRTPTCWLRSYDDIDQTITGTIASNELIEPPAANAPGSLGYAQIDADMRMEFTDLHPALPVKGNEIAGGAESNNQLMFVYVTLTASGLVRPQQAVFNTWDTESATAAGQETSRAHLFIGPVIMQR